jgi:hypothetical protein
MSERFLDWLASIPDIDHPTAALYLCGRKSTGKTLLIEALATMWGDGVPVSFDEASGVRGFNEGMTNNPIISADEAAGVMVVDKAASEAFIRKVLTSRVHELSRKGRGTSKHWGCVRLVAAVNNLARLPFSGGDRNDDENRALAERILFLAPPQEAADLLVGRTQADWLWADGEPGSRPGRLARYVLWLHQTRKQATNGRLLVEGAGLLSELRRSAQGYERLMERIGLALVKRSPPEGFFRPASDASYLYFVSELLWDDWLVADRRPSPATWRAWIHDLTLDGERQRWGGLRRRYRKIAVADVRRSLEDATTLNSCAALDSLDAVVDPEAAGTSSGKVLPMSRESVPGTSTRQGVVP